MNDLSNMYMKSLDTTTPTFVETTHRHTQHTTHRHTHGRLNLHTLPYSSMAVCQYVEYNNTASAGDDLFCLPPYSTYSSTPIYDYIPYVYIPTVQCCA